MNKNKIREMLSGIGLVGVVTTRRLAESLGLSCRTICAAKLKGHLRQIDRNTFDIESIVEWLFVHPRYITGIYNQTPNKQESK